MTKQPDRLFDGREFSAVIFDLDGTLIDSTAAVIRSWTTWATEFGISREALVGNHGVPAAAIVRSVIDQDQIPEALARIEDLELTDVEGVVPLPGAPSALTELRGVPYALATSCTDALAQARLGASGLTPPAVVVTADQVRQGKPAPDPFLLAASRLGVPASDCLVVEDAPRGLQGARAAGCATLAVCTTTPAEELIADEVIPELSAVRWVRQPSGRVVVESRPDAASVE